MYARDRSSESVLLIKRVGGARRSLVFDRIDSR